MMRGRVIVFAIALIPGLALAFLLRPANLQADFIRGAGGGAPPDGPAFEAVGTCVSNEALSANQMTSTLAGVKTGDLVLALIQRDYMNQLTGVTVAGQAMSQLVVQQAGSGGFEFQVWGVIANADTASASVIASFNATNSWGSMVSARWSGVNSATPTQSACGESGCNALASASTSRTALSITTSARSLIVGAGSDWNNYNSHTAVNDYTLHFANNQGLSGCSASVQWLYSKVADAGTHAGAANFGTSASDQTLSAVLAFE